jgi:glutathione S-transferase
MFFPPYVWDVRFGWYIDLRNIDPEEKFSFKEDPQLSYQEQWIAWQHGGLGPMQGQANHFFRLAPHRIQYPTQVRKNTNIQGLIH